MSTPRLADPVSTIEFDVAELAVRLCEACGGIRRPIPDPREALAALDKETRDAWVRSARAAIAYFRERAATAIGGRTEGRMQ